MRARVWLLALVALIVLAQPASAGPQLVLVAATSDANGNPVPLLGADGNPVTCFNRPCADIHVYHSTGAAGAPDWNRPVAEGDPARFGETLHIRFYVDNTGDADATTVTWYTAGWLYNNLLMAVGHRSFQILEPGACTADCPWRVGNLVVRRGEPLFFQARFTLTGDLATDTADVCRLSRTSGRSVNPDGSLSTRAAVLLYVLDEASGSTTGYASSNYWIGRLADKNPDATDKYPIFQFGPLQPYGFFTKTPATPDDVQAAGLPSGIPAVKLGLKWGLSNPGSHVIRVSRTPYFNLHLTPAWVRYPSLNAFTSTFSPVDIQPGGSASHEMSAVVAYGGNYFGTLNYCASAANPYCDGLVRTACSYGYVVTSGPGFSYDENGNHITVPAVGALAPPPVVGLTTIFTPTYIILPASRVRIDTKVGVRRYGAADLYAQSPQYGNALSLHLSYRDDYNREIATARVPFSFNEPATGPESGAVKEVLTSLELPFADAKRITTVYAAVYPGPALQAQYPYLFNPLAENYVPSHAGYGRIPYAFADRGPTRTKLPPLIAFGQDSFVTWLAQPGQSKTFPLTFYNYEAGPATYAISSSKEPATAPATTTFAIGGQTNPSTVNVPGGTVTDPGTVTGELAATVPTPGPDVQFNAVRGYCAGGLYTTSIAGTTTDTVGNLLDVSDSAWLALSVLPDNRVTTTPLTAADQVVPLSLFGPGSFQFRAANETTNYTLNRVQGNRIDQGTATAASAIHRFNRVQTQAAYRSGPIKPLPGHALVSCDALFPVSQTNQNAWDHPNKKHACCAYGFCTTIAFQQMFDAFKLEADRTLHATAFRRGNDGALRAANTNFKFSTAALVTQAVTNAVLQSIGFSVTPGCNNQPRALALEAEFQRSTGAWRYSARVLTAKKEFSTASYGSARAFGRDVELCGSSDDVEEFACNLRPTVFESPDSPFLRTFGTFAA